MYGVIIGGLVALVFLVVLAVKPAWSLHATIIAGLTAFPAFIPYSVQLSSTTIFVYEPFLYFAAGWAIITHPASMIARRRALWLTVLIAAAAIAGIAQQFPTLEIIGDSRGLLSTLAAVVIASRVYGTSHADAALKTLRTSLWVSLIITLAASALHFQVAGRSEAAALFLSTTGAGASDSTRYLTAASQVAVIVFSVVLALVVVDRINLRTAAPYLIPSLALSFLSFSRNSFLAIAFAVVFAIVAARTLKPLVVAVKAAIFVGIPLTILAMANASFGLPGGEFVTTQFNAFMSRVIDGLDPSTLSDDTSAVARVNEDGYLLQGIVQSPLVGHGFGFAYRPAVGPVGSFSATKGQYYGHNFYLWITVKTGILGLAAFLYFAAVPVLKSLWNSSTASIGLGAAGAGVLLAIVFAPFPNDYVNGSSLAVGLLFGALIAEVSKPKQIKQELEPALAGVR